jgi:hypothetical protein
MDALMALADFLHQSAVSEWMRTSLKALPIIEAIHVMAVITVFGTILLVDLRLLGWLDRDRPFTRVFTEILHWTWIAFAVAVVTGVLLFMPNARTYVVNTAFGLKMASLLLAGINMSVFQFTTLKTVARWDANLPVPLGGRIAGGLSILTWTCVIIFGRLIGFTKGYDFSVPEDIDFDFQSCVDCVGAWLAL